MTSHDVSLLLQLTGQLFLVVILQSWIWDNHKRYA